MASYDLSAAADADLTGIYRFGAMRFGLEEADAYFWGLLERLDAIARPPRQFPAVDHIRPGYRRCVYGAHAIYFRQAGDRTQIVRILGRQAPDVIRRGD